MFELIFTAGAAAGTSTSAAFGGRFGGFQQSLGMAPAAAAAATKTENLRRVGRQDGRSFRAQFDVRVQLDLASGTNSI